MADITSAEAMKRYIPGQLLREHKAQARTVRAATGRSLAEFALREVSGSATPC
jgi:hypothetical protein